MNVDQFQGSVVFQLGGTRSRWRPFVSAGAGAALFSAPTLNSETRFSLGVGAGLKWLPTRKAGGRLQVRYIPSYLHDAASDFCDPFGFCQDWLHQVELTGGVIVRF